MFIIIDLCQHSFPDSHACYHNDFKDGIFGVARLALLQKYDTYKLDGFNALVNKPPVIYVSALLDIGQYQLICSRLGLPISCVVQLPRKMTSSGRTRTVGRMMSYYGNILLKKKSMNDTRRTYTGFRGIRSTSTR